MGDTTTIQVSGKLKQDLEAFKENERETYAGVIARLIKIAREEEESEMELSQEVLSGIKEAEEDIRKGRVYRTKQLKKDLCL